MDYSSLPLLNLVKMKLNYHSQRQSLLAQNIANADTPDYKAQDVAMPDFKKLLADSKAMPMRGASGGSSVMRTHPSHMAGSTGQQALRIIDRKTTDELNPNGNNVSVEEEMAKVSENQGEYLKMLNLYSKTVAMFKTAIGNPNNG